MDNTLPREGETYFLNLRFILILTVCIANAAEPLIRQMDGLHALYSWIYTYHMPLFVFVTGYFAKGGLGGPEGRKALLQIGLQYVIFQSLYSLLDAALFKVPDIRHSFFVPYLMLWFLASHMAWRLLMLSMRRFAPAAQCSISLILGVLVGYLPLDGTWLSISRTFVYLPFFVIGYHFSFAAFKRRVTPLKKIAAAALSAALLAVIAFHGLRLPEGWLFGSQTYLQLGHREWYLRRLACPVRPAIGVGGGISRLDPVPPWPPHRSGQAYAVRVSPPWHHRPTGRSFGALRLYPPSGRGRRPPCGSRADGLRSRPTFR